MADTEQRPKCRSSPVRLAIYMLIGAVAGGLVTGPQAVNDYDRLEWLERLRASKVVGSLYGLGAYIWWATAPLRGGTTDDAGKDRRPPSTVVQAVRLAACMLAGAFAFHLLKGGPAGPAYRHNTADYLVDLRASLIVGSLLGAAVHFLTSRR